MGVASARSSVTPERLAFHEAGHAVAAVVLGRAIEWACIDRARMPSLGIGMAESFCKVTELSEDPLVCPADKISPELLGHLSPAATWLAAGSVAEERRFGDFVRAALNDLKAVADVHRRLKSLGELPAGDEFMAFCTKARSAATALLDEQWQAVERLALILTRVRFVSGDVVLEALEQGT